MNLTSTVKDGTLIVTVTASRIDSAIAIQFKEEMRLLTEHAPERVILDLSAVEFIDSSGLGAIVAAMKQLDGNRRLDLAGLTPVVQRVFSLTRMDTVFRIYPTSRAAMSHSDKADGPAGG